MVMEGSIRRIRRKRGSKMSRGGRMEKELSIALGGKGEEESGAQEKKIRKQR